MPDTPTPGQVNYEAYWQVIITEHPDLTARWDSASSLHQRAWEAAAQAVQEQTAPYESFVRLLSCVQAVMRKRRTGDPQMPWETIDALCLHTLEAVMGDEPYQRWQHSTLPLGGQLKEDALGQL